MDIDQLELQHQLGGLCPDSRLAVAPLVQPHVIVRQEQLTKCLHVIGVAAKDFFIRLQDQRGQRRHPTSLFQAFQEKVPTLLGRWDMR